MTVEKGIIMLWFWRWSNTKVTHLNLQLSFLQCCLHSRYCRVCNRRGSCSCWRQRSQTNSTWRGRRSILWRNSSVWCWRQITWLFTSIFSITFNFFHTIPSWWSNHLSRVFSVTNNTICNFTQCCMKYISLLLSSKDTCLAFWFPFLVLLRHTTFLKTQSYKNSVVDRRKWTLVNNQEFIFADKCQKTTK